MDDSMEERAREQTVMICEFGGNTSAGETIAA
jgi:hypothetical protein